MQRLLFALVLATATWAGSALASGEAREHDGGFFVRVAPGVGTFKTTFDDGFDELTFKGLAGDYEAAIGMGLGSNFIVHATLFGASVVDPKLEVNGDEYETDDLTVSLTAFGVGATYYMGESNFYVSGSIGGGFLTAESDFFTEESDTGIAFTASAGKEWWVSDNWGLGAALGVTGHSVPAQDSDEKWTGTSFAVRFSATMN